MKDSDTELCLLMIIFIIVCSIPIFLKYTFSGS